ncbi:MAG: hypothetical protein ACOC44_20505 [Promethearchaeia archaeon]
MEEEWKNWYFFNVEGTSITWGDFIKWYGSLPFYGQLLTIIGIFAIIALVCVLVYYILKGVAYLVYYLLKGIGYLFYYVGLGVYKLFEGLYYLITREHKKQPEKILVDLQPIKNSPKEPTECGRINKRAKRKDPNPDRYIDPVQVEGTKFCPMCGTQFSESARQTLKERGQVFCSYCGSVFAKEPSQMAES